MQGHVAERKKATTKRVTVGLRSERCDYVASSRDQGRTLPLIVELLIWSDIVCKLRCCADLPSAHLSVNCKVCAVFKTRSRGNIRCIPPELMHGDARLEFATHHEVSSRAFISSFWPYLISFFGIV